MLCRMRRVMGCVEMLLIIRGIVIASVWMFTVFILTCMIILRVGRTSSIRLMARNAGCLLI